MSQSYYLLNFKFIDKWFGGYSGWHGHKNTSPLPSEVITACCKYIENPDISSDELIQYVKGPDFPTGGIIVGNSGIKSAYLTGKGSILIKKHQ